MRRPQDDSLQPTGATGNEELRGALMHDGCGQSIFIVDAPIAWAEDPRLVLRTDSALEDVEKNAGLLEVAARVAVAEAARDRLKEVGRGRRRRLRQGRWRWWR